jgi:hypothetical protein
MCFRKHLLLIWAYAEETIPVEDDESFRQEIEQLAKETKQFRTEEERSLHIGSPERAMKRMTAFPNASFEPK